MWGLTGVLGALEHLTVDEMVDTFSCFGIFKMTEWLLLQRTLHLVFYENIKSWCKGDTIMHLAKRARLLLQPGNVLLHPPMTPDYHLYLELQILIGPLRVNWDLTMLFFFKILFKNHKITAWLVIQKVMGSC